MVVEMDSRAFAVSVFLLLCMFQNVPDKMLKTREGWRLQDGSARSAKGGEQRGRGRAVGLQGHGLRARRVPAPGRLGGPRPPLILGFRGCAEKPVEVRLASRSLPSCPFVCALSPGVLCGRSCRSAAGTWQEAPSEVRRCVHGHTATAMSRQDARRASTADSFCLLVAAFPPRGSGHRHPSPRFTFSGVSRRWNRVARSPPGPTSFLCVRRACVRALRCHTDRSFVRSHSG